MPYVLNEQLNEFVSAVRASLGKSIKSVILYGSYARGDYNDSSDIDVMVLVDIDEKDIHRVENIFYDLAFDSELKYGKCLSPVIKNIDSFEYWADTLPFYRNVKKEGVKVA